MYIQWLILVDGGNIMNIKNYVILSERKQLTNKEQTVIESIIKYQKIYGFSPSIRELGEMVGLKSTSSVYSHLKSLEKNGYIVRRADSPRTIVIL